MAQIEFLFNGIKTIIKCKINEKLKNICKSYAKEIQKDLNQLNFIYDGKILKKNLLKSSFFEKANDIDKERKKMNLLAYEKNSNK